MDELVVGLGIINEEPKNPFNFFFNLVHFSLSREHCSGSRRGFFDMESL